MPGFTVNYKLGLPDFDSSGWDTMLKNNFTTIDAVVGQFNTGLVLQGAWLNSTLYLIAQSVVDPTTGKIWICGVQHTSAVTPVTFATDRASYPTYWADITNPAATAKQSADSATASAAAAAASAASVGSTTGTGNLVRATGATLVAPLLGTPASVVLSNATGLPLTTGVLGAMPTANGGTALTTFTINGALYATSANVLVSGTLPVVSGGTGVITSTGTGNNVLSSNPVLVAPALGTIASGVATNLTGTATALNIGGTAATATTATTAANLAGGSVAATTGTFSTPVGVASGGTGAATLAANALIVGNGTGAVATLAPGASGNVATSNGTAWASSTPAAQSWTAGAVSSVAGGLAVSAGVLSSPTTAGAVGTYVIAQAAGRTFGTTYAASTLFNLEDGTAMGLSGTWRCMGQTTFAYYVCVSISIRSGGLFLRIS